MPDIFYTVSNLSLKNKTQPTEMEIPGHFTKPTNPEKFVFISPWARTWPECTCIVIRKFLLFEYQYSDGYFLFRDFIVKADLIPSINLSKMWHHVYSGDIYRQSSLLCIVKHARNISSDI